MSVVKIAAAVLAVLFLAFPQVGAAQFSQKAFSRFDSKGSIFYPALELTNSLGQKVLIVGMNHVGFEGYYNSVNQYINKWVKKEQKKTVVLREFFTCNGTVLDNFGVEVTQDQVNSLSKSNIDFSLDNFMSADSDQLSSLLKVFGMQKSVCELDVDGKTKRPPYYVRRNKNWCAMAQAHGATCQWLKFDVPNSDIVTNMEGDIKVDEWNAGMQVSASLLFGEYGKLDMENDATWAIFQNSAYLMMDYREFLLMHKVHGLLSSGVSRIVLPWGASHIVGLYKMLKEEGFVQTRIDDIKYLDRSQLGKWDIMDEGFDLEDYTSSDHYEFLNN